MTQGGGERAESGAASLSLRKKKSRPAAPSLAVLSDHGRGRVRELGAAKEAGPEKTEPAV